MITQEQITKLGQIYNAAYDEYEAEWGANIRWNSNECAYMQFGELPHVPEAEGGFTGVTRDENGVIWVDGDSYVETRQEFIREKLAETFPDLEVTDEVYEAAALEGDLQAFINGTVQPVAA